MPSNEERLALLCVDFVNAKTDETRATEKRIAIEQDIIAITGLPEEGSSTTDTAGFKIKVEQRINRKLDVKAWGLVCDQIPEALRPVTIVEEHKIETKGVNWLKEHEQGYYKLLCGCMTEKPAKPSVKIEVLNETK